MRLFLIIVIIAIFLCSLGIETRLKDIATNLQYIGGQLNSINTKMEKRSDKQ